MKNEIRLRKRGFNDIYMLKNIYLIDMFKIVNDLFLLFFWSNLRYVLEAHKKSFFF